VKVRIPVWLRLLLLLLLVASAVAAGFAAPAGAAGRQYAALGDSYTSGPLIPNQLPDPPGCLRSDHNYPHLTAAALKLSLSDVSCGGATTDDMTAPQQTAAGTNPPQLDAVGPGTTVVTLGIGGNDIGFISIVEKCTAVTPYGPTESGYQYCKDYYNRNGYDELAQAIAATQPKVERVLGVIHAKAPGAKIYVVGYPAILPSDDLTPQSPVQCWPQLPVTYADIPYLRETEQRLDAMLASAAADQGASYVDTYSGSVDHNACTLPGTRWIEPSVPSAPAAPVHPNAAGEAYMASVVSAAIRK
jgi:lysophospholipase L1-like esterase